MDAKNSAGAARAASAGKNGCALDTTSAKVLAAITKAAEAGEQCPTNQALTELIGAKTESGGASAIARLRRLGRITIQRDGAGRVVTVVATGKSTASRAVTESSPTVTGPWSAEEDAVLERELAAGKGPVEIAKLLGRAKSSVWHRANPTRRAARAAEANPAQAAPTIAAQAMCHNCGSRIAPDVTFACWACRDLRKAAA
ncbi:helix-turn-helix domain-containing protein [Sphingomonas desiccabilis]|uniref:Helix-turn-helix domain-containing protein n=1 Tax=Sphingomonas desiccabilis TaxID=429134 RepID=A0A4Q2J165_9SPHN|nr:helix-turn-helix domain-containing protein [Sphingomonas desiccabilis]MBB3910859.1 hypothetical protein [Sphingomonas desiccabilis]RXZ35463.1 helix-turn-helix domain-containing protein [Sphingomonas desiccabilis]